MTKSSEKTEQRKILSMRALPSVFPNFQLSQLLSDIILAEIAEALLKLSQASLIKPMLKH